jgi:putative transposase
VNGKDRSYRIWQRDPLAVCMDSKWKVEQKLDSTQGL